MSNPKGGDDIMEQLDLLGVTQPEATPRELGHRAAEAAADNAGEDWKDLAYRRFCEIARQLGRPFITKEVRDMATDVPAPPDPRAWGYVAKRLAREGLIVSDGLARPRHVHGSTVTLWRWKHD